MRSRNRTDTDCWTSRGKPEIEVGRITFAPSILHHSLTSVLSSSTSDGERPLGAGMDEESYARHGHVG